MSRLRGVQRPHGRLLRQLRLVLGVVGQHVAVTGCCLFGYGVLAYVDFGYACIGYACGAAEFGYARGAVVLGYACGAAEFGYARRSSARIGCARRSARIGYVHGAAGHA